MQILEGYAEFESFCLHCARYNSAAEATSLLSSVASLATTRKLIIFLFSTFPFFFYREAIYNILRHNDLEKQTIYIRLC